MKFMPLPVVRKIFLLVVFGFIAGGCGYWFGSQGYRAIQGVNGSLSIVRDLPPDKAALDFSLFWQVWDKVHESYYDGSKLDTSTLVYGAIEGMVRAVGDPYTVFLPPQENKVVQEDLQGSFDGVGIQIGFKGTQLAVVAPLPDTPAALAGVRAGDFILGITDEQKQIDMGTVGISLPEAVQAIRGPRGSVVTLTLGRDSLEEPLVVDIVRENIDVPSVTMELVGENQKIAHVRLLKFAGETESEWNSTVSQLQAGNIEKVILDLRDNPGGYLDGAVDIASDFLSKGVVVIEDSGDGNKVESRVSRPARLAGVDLVVLVNSGSASASEIVAGALKDNNRAQIIGVNTFGKGTIQEPQQVGQGSGLHVTIARWLTPSGFWVNEGGLVPNIVIEDDPETSQDEQLQEAIGLIETI